MEFIVPIMLKFEDLFCRSRLPRYSVKVFGSFKVVAIVFVAILSFGTHVIHGDIVLNSVGVAVVEDFNDFRGLGFDTSPSAGQLDSDTYRAIGFDDGPGAFGGTHTSGDFARGTSTGGVSTGGAYAFEVGGSGSGDFAVGVQPTGDDFTPGTFTIRGRNGTGQTISGIGISATGYFFSDQDRSTRWTFEFSTNDTDYTELFFLDSPEAAGAAQWDATPISQTIPLGAGIADNQQFFIRVTGEDLSGTGFRDEFAMDNLSLTAVPEPSGFALLAAMVVPFCSIRKRKA